MMWPVALLALLFPPSPQQKGEDQGRRFRDQVERQAGGRGVASRPRPRIGANGFLAFGNNDWKSIGPTAVQPGPRTYQGIQSLGGRVDAVAVSSKGVVALGTPYSGAWIKKASVWEQLVAPHSWLLQVSSLTFDPTGRFLYVGTGAYDGPSESGNEGLWCYDTLNDTWEALAQEESSGCAVRRLLIDPADPKTLVLLTGRGVDVTNRLFVSHDSGKTWNPTPIPPACWIDGDVSQPPGTQGVLLVYGLVYGWRSGKFEYVAYRSTDHGEKWETLWLPQAAKPELFRDRIAIAASQVKANVHYVVDPANQQIWLYDGVATEIAGAQTPEQKLDAWSNSYYNLRFRVVKATLGDSLYLGMTDLTTRQAGATAWQSMAGPSYTNNAILHLDQHDFHFPGDQAAAFYVANDGGLYEGKRQAGGAVTWSPQASDVSFVQTYDFAISNTLSLVATHDLGAVELRQQKWHQIIGGDIGHCEVSDDIAHSQRVIVGSSSGGEFAFHLWDGAKYNRGAVKFDEKKEPCDFLPPLAVTMNGSFSATNVLYRLDSGTGVRYPHGPTVTVGEHVTTLAGHRKSQQLYAGSSNGEVHWSGPDGRSWTKIDDGVLPAATVLAIAPHSAKMHDVLVSFASRHGASLYHCADVTQTPRVWRPVVTGGRTVCSLLRVPSSEDKTWYAGTVFAVLRTKDAGANWEDVSAPNGLQPLQVTRLRLLGGDLYAATMGRGIWKWKVTP